MFSDRAVFQVMRGGARPGAGRKRRTDIKIGDRFGSFTVTAIINGRATTYQIECRCGAIRVRDGSDLSGHDRHTCTACSKAIHLAWGSLVRCGRDIGGAGSRTKDPLAVTCADCKAERLDVRRFACNLTRIVRAAARNRGHEFLLSVDDVIAIRVGKPCVFCGADLGGCAGLDRVDSRIGYVSGNVQPCCGPCNSAKGTLEDDEFRAAMAVRLAKTGPGRAWVDFKPRSNRGDFA